MSEKFREYLLGHKCIVYTDNNPLSHLSSAKLGATEQRWAAQLAAFDFEIKYRSGRSNKNGDAYLGSIHLGHRTWKQWFLAPRSPSPCGKPCRVKTTLPVKLPLLLCPIMHLLIFRHFNKLIPSSRRFWRSGGRSSVPTLRSGNISSCTCYCTPMGPAG